MNFDSRIIYFCATKFWILCIIINIYLLENMFLQQHKVSFSKPWILVILPLRIILRIVHGFLAHLCSFNIIFIFYTQEHAYIVIHQIIKANKLLECTKTFISTHLYIKWEKDYINHLDNKQSSYWRLFFCIQPFLQMPPLLSAHCSFLLGCMQGLGVLE